MRVVDVKRGADDAAKFLLELADGNTVEALYMCDRSRRLTYSSTACVSSQVGCAMGCLFCATGAQGFVRDLGDGEICAQVRVCDAFRGEEGFPPIEAVVFAGMGEPLLNYENVVSAMEKIKAAMGIGRFELATAGVAPKIDDLARDVVGRGLEVRLNVSLHAATDEKRCRLIPLTKKYGVGEIIDAAERFAGATGTTVRLRYMLIRGFNDSGEDARNLVRLLEGRPRMKVVLSAYNDNGVFGLSPPDELDVLNFFNKIKGKLSCGIFHNFGGAILGGCGQLRRRAAPASRREITGANRG